LLKTTLALAAGLIFRAGSPAGNASELQALSGTETPEAIVRDQTGDRIVLNIPDRGQAPGAPAQGWCGEAALQQALLFQGAYFPQKDIHQAADPPRQDLYAQDLPVVLRALQIRHRYAPQPRSLDKFQDWIRDEIRAGRPVLVGMKIYPTEHPSWALDHFTLVVGVEGEALIINTTWKEQRTFTQEQLLSTAAGLAFKNRFDSYFGISIHGATGKPGQARLLITRSREDGLEAVVRCEDLAAGSDYQLRQAPSVNGAAEVLATFTADGSTQAYRLELDPAKPAVFSCRPVEPGK
jgi:hypothetical protein